MRVVGSDRLSPLNTPRELWARGRRLDAVLASLPSFAPRGVFRLTHAQMNRMDEERTRQRAGWFASNARRPA